MANLHRHPHRLMQIIHRDQVHAPGVQRARIQMVFSSYNHLLRRPADLDHIEWRAGSHAESLALAHGEVVNATVLAEDFAVRGYEFTGGVGQSLALLGEIGVDEALVVAAGDEANFLRVGLLRERESVPASEFANFRLGHVAQRKHRAAQLLLSQAEQKISLILTRISRTLEQPPATIFVKGHAGVVPGGYSLGTNLLRYNK